MLLLLLVLLLLPVLLCSRWLSNLVGLYEGGALTGISFWLDERASRDAVDGGSQRLSLVILFHQYKRAHLALQAGSHSHSWNGDAGAAGKVTCIAGASGPAAISFWLDEGASRDAVDGGSQRLSLVFVFHQYQRESLALQARFH